MRSETFTFKDPEGWGIFVYKWLPDNGVKARAVVEIVHGMCEHAARYNRFAEALTREGYLVYAQDLRAHGKTAGSIENLGYAGRDGFNQMVVDIKQLNDILKKENPGLPVFLFGHSFGSFLSQAYVAQYGDTIKAVVLSGTAGKQSLLNLGIAIATIQMLFFGPKYKSKLLHTMTFKDYNNSFKPNRTKSDWLSRDQAEVDKYVNDPYCGTVSSAGFFYDLLRGLKYIHEEETMKNIPKNLPVYLFSGTHDPVGNMGKGPSWLFNTYKKLGIEDLKLRLYENARHETLNEINRDEVTRDVINWLNAHC